MDIETTKLVEKISSINTRIDALKAMEQRYIGERSGVQTRLKDEFSIKSVAQAKARLTELDETITEEKVSLTNLIVSIEARVGAIENAVC